MRLLEIVSEQNKAIEIEQLLQKDYVIEQWSYKSENGQVVTKVLMQDEYAKELLASLEKQSKCRVVIYSIEGTLPEISTIKSNTEKIKVGKFIAISKEELYNDISQPISLSMNFILMVVLSSFVAGIGILKDNIAIIIGAMVIAPFLGLNMSLAFGTILSDWSVIKKSILTGAAATIIALVISMIWGFTASDLSTITIDPDIEYQDIILALVCGFAGVISIISGQNSTLVGVMVAAALLPPLMRGGLLFGAGDYQYALNSFLIFSANIICLNIAGIVTFYLAGIKPGRWADKKKAKKKARTAFIIWICALVSLIIVIIKIKQLG